MALQAQIAGSSFVLGSRAMVSANAEGYGRETGIGWSRAISPAVGSSSRFRRRLPIPTVRSSLDISVPAVGTVTEVGNDTFWPIVNAAGDKVVVLDMYTQWCGPCKIIAPKYEGLSKTYTDVVFLKLDCNHENRPLAKELGIRAVPTFKIFRNGQVVKEVTGAKFDELVMAIETARSS
ncbi:thioredoxin F-type, chloroplastic-like [Wolffia australiana]